MQVTGNPSKRVTICLRLQCKVSSNNYEGHKNFDDALKFVQFHPIRRSSIQFKICGQRAGTQLEEMRKGGKTREGESKEGHPEGQHGCGAHSCGKCHPTEEPIGQLFANERTRRRGRQSRPIGADHTEREYSAITKGIPEFHRILHSDLQVTNSMAGVVRAMDSAMKSMNLEKISNIMEKFEQQFEDLDVQSSYMENTMSQTTTTAVPQGDVDQLLSQVADEAGYVSISLGEKCVVHYVFVCSMSLQIGAEHGAAERSASIDAGRLDGRVTGTGRADAATGTIAAGRIIIIAVIR